MAPKQETRDRRELRTWPLSEIRVDDVDGKPHIVGHAAVFNRDSEDMGFIERIRPGAFRDVINDDVLALWSHDSGLVLGRTSAETLSLKEDQAGLAFDNEPPDVGWVRDRLESIRRRDVTGASFAFSVEEEEWTSLTGEPARREIILIRRLWEISPGVAFPAYPDTDVALRSLDRWRENLQSGRSIHLLRGELQVEEALGS